MTAEKSFNDNDGFESDERIVDKVFNADTLKNNEEVDFKQKSNKSIKTKKSNQDYTVDYFNNLAKKIKEDPNFVSDRDFIKAKDDEFIPFDNIVDVNLKADLKEKGKRLENEDHESAIKFYDNLKKHRLFINDYYPYRRQCILYKNKLNDDLGDWQTI